METPFSQIKNSIVSHNEQEQVLGLVLVLKLGAFFGTLCAETKTYFNVSLSPEIVRLRFKKYCSFTVCHKYS